MSTRSQSRVRIGRVLFVMFGGAAVCWVCLMSIGAREPQRRTPTIAETPFTAPPPAPSAARPNAPPPRSIAPRVAALTASVALPTTDGYVDPQTFNSLPEAERRRLDRAHFASYFDKLDGLRLAERSDLHWQQEIEASASEVMASTPELQQSKLSSVECGASLCKVVATHEDPMAQEIFQHYFLREMGLTASVQYLDGSSTVYLARSEEALPSFD